MRVQADLRVVLAARVNPRLATLAALALSLFSPSARAGNTKTCLDAAERGEQLKKGGQLVAARAALLICSKDACPAPVRAVCRRYLDEVDSAIPTLELAVHDAAGNDLKDVNVIIDGEPRSRDANGAFPVDPGARRVRVERGAATEEVLVKVAVGQKRTPVVVTFRAAAKANETAASPGPRLPEREPPRVRTTAGPLPWLLGGVGVLALGGGAAFGVKWMGDTDCRPRCSSEEVARIRTDGVLTDVFVGVGLVSLGVSAALFLRAQRTSGAPSGGATSRATDANRTAP